MAIELITGRVHTPLTVKTTQKAEVDSEQKASVKSVEKTDSVVITERAQGIKKIFESPVDVDRVAAVKKALADGNYPIDAKRIAEKMIQSEKLFQSTPNRIA